MVQLSYLGSGYILCFGAPIHTSRNTDIYDVLNTFSYWVRSSIRIPTSVYVYLWVEFGTINNTIIFMGPALYIHLMLVVSSKVESS